MFVRDYKKGRGFLNCKVGSQKFGTEADWLECSTCNAKSAGSSLVQESYHVGTLNKFFAHNCSAILLHLHRRGM